MKKLKPWRAAFTTASLCVWYMSTGNCPASRPSHAGKDLAAWLCQSRHAEAKLWLPAVVHPRVLPTDLDEISSKLLTWKVSQSACLPWLATLIFEAPHCLCQCPCQHESSWKAGHRRELARLLDDTRFGKRKYDYLLIWSLDRLCGQDICNPS